MLVACGPGGCTVDCQETYCDVVRAGASAYFGWELQCCRDPDDPGCADRAVRMQQYSLFAAEIRRACQDENWQRVRDLWQSIVPLLPGGMLVLAAEEFCDGWDWAGCNVATPFTVTDHAIGAVTLDSSRRRLRVATDREPGGSPGRLEIERAWSVRPGSAIAFETWGVRTAFAVSGDLAAVETPQAGPGLDEEVESWCRHLVPESLELVLESGTSWCRLTLDPTFEGNRFHFDDADSGELRAAVEVDGTWTLPGGGGLEIVDRCLLAIPFRLGPEGRMDWMPDGPVSMLDLRPVDPAVEAWMRDLDPRRFDDDLDGDCVRRAREVASSFLAVHPACGVAATDQ